IAACGLQEYPPGWAAVALHARSTGEPDPADVVTVNAMRGSPYVVPRRDVAVFTTALVPDDDGLRALVGTAQAKELAAAGLTPREALDRVAAAAREALADGPLERDAFHQALRERLPDALLPWCRGCQSHHVRPGLWRALGPLGVTQMPAKATYALAEPTAMELPEARSELVRRFLRCFGPATHSQLAAWAQTAPSHAKALFAAVGGELEAVRLEGRHAFVLAADAARLETPPAARGVHLLGGHDPYVAQPDRAALAPDPALRRRIFVAVGRPGIVLRDGGPAGLWRARKRGDLLDVTVQWLGAPVDITAQAEAIARLRGCATARWAATPG
ncbi:MAG: winged helix DNA-binding domain-containing protein, partial [Actinomycetota bacterium]|nr:winged helix DNA-binding domain-containing protein [Actinomycetota bacterium]